jgi:uncharacterized protein YbaA (DUF1428 family)
VDLPHRLEAPAVSLIEASLTPVARDRREACRLFAARMAQVYRDHGALRVTEAWGADVPEAQEAFHAAPMPEAAPDLREAGGAGEGEVVVLTLIEWPDHAAREAAMERIREDPRVRATLHEAPVFDGARVRSGTFTAILDA